MRSERALNSLRWYQDHSDATLPQGWLLSIPLYVYRLAMLAWALWVYFAQLKIIKWGWQLFSQPVLWYKPERKAKSAGDGVVIAKPESPPAAAGEAVDLSNELKLD